jgi:hypothetical protein
MSSRATTRMAGRKGWYASWVDKVAAGRGIGPNGQMTPSCFPVIQYVIDHNVAIVLISRYDCNTGVSSERQFGDGRR